jgi:hypothetical protein
MEDRTRIQRAQASFGIADPQSERRAPARAARDGRVDERAFRAREGRRR